jgi:uncharacterized membrane protein
MKHVKLLRFIQFLDLYVCHDLCSQVWSLTILASAWLAGVEVVINILHGCGIYVIISDPHWTLYDF